MGETRDDLTAHRTRTNRREERHALGMGNVAAEPAASIEQEVPRSSAADSAAPQEEARTQALTPHPATVAEINQVMADVIEDRD